MSFWKFSLNKILGILFLCLGASFMPYAIFNIKFPLLPELGLTHIGAFILGSIIMFSGYTFITEIIKIDLHKGTLFQKKEAKK